MYKENLTRNRFAFHHFLEIFISRVRSRKPILGPLIRQYVRGGLFGERKVLVGLTECKTSTFRFIILLVPRSNKIRTKTINYRPVSFVNFSGLYLPSFFNLRNRLHVRARCFSFNFSNTTRCLAAVADYRSQSALYTGMPDAG